MDDDRDDIASMVFNEPLQPSRYLASLMTSSPGARRAQTINLDNPYNPAVAYPSYHIGIDAKEPSTTSGFSVRMAQLDDIDSQSLASTTAGRPNTYRPRALMAAQRREKLIANSAKAAKGTGKKTRVNPAPGRADSPESAFEEAAMSSRRRAAVAGEKKRKRASRGDQDDEFDGVGAEAEESEEHTRTPKRRVTKNPIASASLVPGAPAATTNTPGFPPSSLLRKRDAGIKVPKSIDEACEADRMLWEWRHASKPWADITRKWTELSGKTPGKSTLSVRFIKLQENFSQTGGADDILLLQYKAEAEGEMEEELWQKVSDKIKTHHDVQIPPNQLRKRFSALKQSGFEIGGDLEMDGDVVQTLDAPQPEASLEAASISAQPEEETIETNQGTMRLVDYSNSESDM